MARYTDSVCRLCRYLGMKLFLKGERCYSPKCAVERRPYPPGSRSQRRRKISDRGLQLREKQKARRSYGVLENQFHRYYVEAMRQHGAGGETMVQLLEKRLDNVVFRLGFGASRSQARQYVRHGHISVNERKVDIPSFSVKVGDVIGWTDRGKRSAIFTAVQEQMGAQSVPAWLSLDITNMQGRVADVPQVGDMDVRFSPNAIIEYYSR